MSKIISRIQEFAENQGISIRELERKSSVTNGVFSKAIRFGNEISTDKVENLLQAYPSISAEWLLRGEGEMLTQSEDSLSQNPTLDFVIRHMASQIDELKAQVKDLETKNDKLLDERNDLLVSNRSLQYQLDLARKGEIAGTADGSFVANAV